MFGAFALNRSPVGRQPEPDQNSGPDQCPADRGHHRRHPAVGELAAGIAVDILGTRLELQNLVRDGG